MTGSAEDAREASEVFDFLSVFLADREEGRALPLEEYQARFPGCASSIAAEYDRVLAEDREAEGDGANAERRFGPYAVEYELGRGGQGTVYLARDTRLGRRVALKLLAPILDFGSRERLARFRRECELLSQLEHPGICAVYEADVHENVPFLAMRFVEGETLSSLLQARRARGELPRTREEIAEVLRWMEAAARALHAAHELGIVHRDVKPGNLRITPRGEPVLLDFGLARPEAREDAALTQTGTLVGTLAYLAPELLSPTGARADRRADVYALGVTLYECLTHVLPFTGKTRAALWQAIEQGDSAPPRAHNPALPRDLASVVSTAIAKSPARRYATAAEFADDLERARTQQPVHARATPLAERIVRWVRKHPTLSIGTLAVLALFGVLLFALEQMRSRERSARALHRSLGAAASDEDAASALADLVAASEDRLDASVRTALLQVLDHCHLAYQVPRTRPPSMHNDPPPALDARGERFALADAAGVIQVFDAASGTVLLRRQIAERGIAALLFAEPESLWCADADGVLRELDARSLEERSTLAPLGAKLARPEPAAWLAHGLALSPDRTLLALGETGRCSLRGTREERGERGALRIVELDTGVAVRTLLFSPDGSLLLLLAHLASEDPDAADCGYVVRVADGAVLHRLEAREENLACAAWHASGEAIALGRNGGRVEVRDAQSFAICFERDVAQEVNWCGFDPSGELLIVPSDRGTDFWRWREPDAEPVRHVPHPTRRTWGAAAFDVERGWLASVHRDGTVAVMDARDGRALRSFKQRMVNARFASWLPAVGLLLTADMDKVTAWHAGARPHGPELWGHADAVTALATRRSSPLIASASLDGTARLWDPRRAATVQRFDHGGAAVSKIRFAPDGAALLTAASDGRAHLWNAESGAELATLQGHAGPLVDARFLADGRRAITLGEDGVAHVWDLAQQRIERTLEGRGAPIRCADLHPDEPWIALGYADRWAVVWNWANGEVLSARFLSEGAMSWRLNPLHQVRGVLFDPPRRRMLASLVNNYLYTCPLESTSAPQPIFAYRFGGPLARDPRSGKVICADYSFGLLSILSDADWRPLEREGRAPHSNRITSVAIDPTSRFALSAGCDGELWVWDLEREAVHFGARLDAAILAAEFSADGRWIIAGTSDGRIKLWPVDVLEAAHGYLAQRRH